METKNLLYKTVWFYFANTLCSGRVFRVTKNDHEYVISVKTFGDYDISGKIITLHKDFVHTTKAECIEARKKSEQKFAKKTTKAKAKTNPIRPELQQLILAFGNHYMAFAPNTNP